jgi:hypothetical protein
MTVTRPGKEKMASIEPVIDAGWPIVDKADA